MTPKLLTTPLSISLLNAHYNAAKENSENLSSQVAKAAFMGSGNVTASIVAAFSTAGLRHAPVINTRDWVQSAFAFQKKDQEFGEVLLSTLDVIPGFGHSLHKDKIDPIFKPVYDMLPARYRMLADHVQMAIGALRGKTLYPNAAYITACVAHELQLPPYMEVWYFLAGRCPSWIESFTLPPQTNQQ